MLGRSGHRLHPLSRRLAWVLSTLVPAVLVSIYTVLIRGSLGCYGSHPPVESGKVSQGVYGLAIGVNGTVILSLLAPASSGFPTDSQNSSNYFAPHTLHPSTSHLARLCPVESCR